MCKLKPWTHAKTSEEKEMQRQHAREVKAKYRREHPEHRRVSKQRHYQLHREEELAKQKIRNHIRKCKEMLFCIKCGNAKTPLQFRVIDKITKQREQVCRECRRAEERLALEEWRGQTLARRVERLAATEQRREERKLAKEAKRLVEGESFKEEQRKRSAYFLAHRGEIIATAEAYRAEHGTDSKPKERLVDMVRRLQEEIKKVGEQKTKFLVPTG